MQSAKSERRRVIFMSVIMAIDRKAPYEEYATKMAFPIAVLNRMPRLTPPKGINAIQTNECFS